MKKCEKCDGCGSQITYKNQALLPLSGRVRGIDWCIHHIVAALNAAGIETIASCCGHQIHDGRIDLEDGRILTIAKEYRGVGASYSEQDGTDK